MTQHASLDAARWAGFDLDRQVLMIANEMNRTLRLLGPDDRDRRRRGYARTLRLVDLTVEGAVRASFRRELLRWRDTVAALYLAEEGDAGAHREALRTLLLLRPVASHQIPLLLG